ncbi:hypothetical protein NF212_13985 [Parasalinivibrio latis]
MVLRGCQRFPDPMTFWQLGSRLALTECNASTQPDSTQFHLSSLFEADAQEALEYFLNATLSPLLLSQDFWQEVRGVLCTEMQGYINRPEFSRSLSLAAMRPQRLPFYGGLPDTIRELTVGNVRYFHRQHYQPEKLKIILGGKWNIEKVMTALKLAVDAKNELPEGDFVAPAVCWVANPRAIENVQSLIVSGLPDELWPGVRTLLHAQHEIINKAGWKLLPPLEDDLFSRAVAKGKSLRVLQFELLDHGNPKTDLSGLIESLLYDMDSSDVYASVKGRQFERYCQQSTKYGLHLAELYHAFQLVSSEPGPLPPMPDRKVAVSPFRTGQNRILQPGDYHRQYELPAAMETLGMCIRFPGSDYDAARQALCFLRYFEQRSEEVFEAKQKPGRFSVAYHNGISGVMALRADIPVEEAGFCQTLWREMLEKSLEPMRCSNKLYSHWQQVTGFQKVLREACNGLGGWHQAGEHIHSPQHFVQIWPPEPCSLREWLESRNETQSPADVSVSFTFEPSPEAHEPVGKDSPELLLRGDIRCISEPGAAVVSVCLPETANRPLWLAAFAHAVLSHEDLRQSRLSGEVYALGVDIDFALCRLTWFSYFDRAPENTVSRILATLDDIAHGQLPLPVTSLQRAALGEWQRRYCKQAVEYHAHINHLQGLVEPDPLHPPLTHEGLKSLSGKARKVLSYVQESRPDILPK